MEEKKLEAPIEEELGRIPRLPRGGGFSISTPNLIRILFTAAVLVMIIVIQKPCAEHVSSFVTSYGQGSAPQSGSSSAMPHPGTVDKPREYEQITPDMTPEQVKAAVERAKARAAAEKK